jgi:hypothetical protein
MSIFPVQGKRDAIGKYRGERGLDCRLDPIRQNYSLIRHACQQAFRAPGSPTEHPICRCADPLRTRPGAPSSEPTRSPPTVIDT